MAAYEFSPEDGEPKVKLDGLPIEIPSDRATFRGIRSYLELLALQQQRLLCWISVDGQAVNLTQAGVMVEEFERVDAETMSLDEVPAQLIKGALHQTISIRARVQSALELVLINDAQTGQELWWNLATSLKEPLLTLSLLPESVFGPEHGGASPIQLRKWQLQQLGFVIQEVDSACETEDRVALTEALETRVLPWLDKLQQSLELWSEAVSYSPASISACSEAADPEEDGFQQE